jgi:hypothetical protein
MSAVGVDSPAAGQQDAAGRAKLQPSARATHAATPEVLELAAAEATDHVNRLASPAREATTIISNMYKEASLQFVSLEFALASGANKDTPERIVGRAGLMAILAAKTSAERRLAQLHGPDLRGLTPPPLARGRTLELEGGLPQRLSYDEVAAPPIAGPIPAVAGNAEELLVAAPVPRPTALAASHAAAPETGGAGQPQHPGRVPAHAAERSSSTSSTGVFCCVCTMWQPRWVALARTCTAGVCSQRTAVSTTSKPFCPVSHALRLFRACRQSAARTGAPAAPRGRTSSRQRSQRLQCWQLLGRICRGSQA